MMNSSLIDQSETKALKKQWDKILSKNPSTRIREAAKQLQVSEATLLATTIGKDCIRLEGDWKKFMKSLPDLGYVMSLTRNESCILEHKGHFEKVKVFGSGDHQMAVVLGAIETRVFLKNWHVGFAVKQEKRGRELISLQLFDKLGVAITKIYLQPNSNYNAYHEIVSVFQSKNQSGHIHFPGLSKENFTEEVDKNAFVNAWSQLEDTHDFFGLLKEYNLHRHFALELADGEFTTRINPSATISLLKKAAAAKLPIMIFAGNHGNLQIHQGPVKTIRLLERGHEADQKWLNVLDPKFNLHMRQDHIATAWVVKKPTKDGVVTSIEVFDQNKDLIAQFFGLRKPGQEELQSWRDLVAELITF